MDSYCDHDCHSCANNSVKAVMQFWQATLCAETALLLCLYPLPQYVVLQFCTNVLAM